MTIVSFIGIMLDDLLCKAPYPHAVHHSSFFIPHSPYAIHPTHFIRYTTGMISPETKATLRRLLAEQPTYRPVPAVLEKLQHITFVCFVGATCMGKTTLMDALVALDPKRYGKTRNFTTRPPRADDDPKRYYYYEHSDEGLQPVLARIAARENLQHNINPFNLYVYGSELADYPHRYNLGDIFSSSIDGLRQLGYGKLVICSVVTDPDTWQQRLEARFPVGHPQRADRLREAVMSLEWSLAQHATDHQLVFSPEKRIEATATSVDYALRHETAGDQAEATRLAKQCLTRARQL